MATINIVVPRIHPTRFSGGLLCILNYSKGLTSRGHTVTLFPFLPSRHPQWLDGNIGQLHGETASSGARELLSSVMQLVVNTSQCDNTANVAINRRMRVRRLTRVIARRLVQTLPSELQNAVGHQYVKESLEQHGKATDITIATSFETAQPVSLYGTGKKYYFAQHYEPYFCDDMEDPKRAAHDAKASYTLGLQQIANSSWLQEKLQNEHRIPVALCPNAIDHDIFSGTVARRSDTKRLRIISYGGRGVRWKGFMDMAEAVRIARTRLPEYQIEWSVYGQCELPPVNHIANFINLGFLAPKALARAYRESDVLLSASWYESFPLFPIEAMACGLAVITSQTGTEEFAEEGKTAAIVKPQCPESIANALIRLCVDEDYRLLLATGGSERAKRFTWESSVSRMEEILGIK